MRAWIVLLALAVLAGCAPERELDRPIVLVFPGSAVGAEAEVLRRQLAEFERLHPEIRVVQQLTPDAADQRHQLFVQWLNAGAPEPDLLQLDVIWTAEFAAAGWILPLNRFEPELDDFFPAAREANLWQNELFALPWFADVGMLYFRTDLMQRAPASLHELRREALAAKESGAVRHGLVWQGARYEGLVTVFVEQLGAFGGRILDDSQNVVVDSPAAVRALEHMRDAIHDSGYVPRAVLGWQEEQTRFAFQNGEAAAMRNWPYAAPLLANEQASRVAGRFSIAPMPGAEGGEPTAALGGASLAINRNTKHPEAAWTLVHFLTGAEQMIERARGAGQLPARRSVYAGDALAGDLAAAPGQFAAIIERARARPVTPIYTEISQILQIHLHRALTGQAEPEVALSLAAAEMRERIDAAGLQSDRAHAPREAAKLPPLLLALALALALLATWLWLRARRRRGDRARADNRDARLAWPLVLPALAVIGLVALFPLGWTVWESLHFHDLRMPWRGRPFVGLDNYAALLSSGRFWSAFGRTLIFTAASVSLELVIGLAVALVLDWSIRARGALRALALLPWAIPTVVAALVWRFLFEPSGWLTHSLLAWVPLVLADVWKTTPFVALLLLAGLQTIDARLYEAARIDGAGAWQRLRFVTLPLLRPAIVVALLFRTLDAFRVFDLPYVLTGGGPGTATEPIALLTFSTLLSSLRFGYGAALSVLVFGTAFSLALLGVRYLGRDAGGLA
jgi:ABC-type sugar transport system permease subunit/ABC-type glycerol-3-phosphate transport system substrate-binding protein